MTVVAFIGTLVVLCSYAASVQRREPTIFHVGNVVGAPILVVTGLALGASAHAVLSGCFGLVAVRALTKGSTA